MDPVDFAVYRFLSPDGVAKFWAGRRIIDPSMAAREIGARVGISENAVRGRLRNLADRGILRGTAVTPNPSLFGVRVFVTELPVKTSAVAERVLRDLALVEGVIFARDTLEEGARRIGVYFVSNSEAATTRRVALLRRLTSSATFRAPQAYTIPLCERQPSALDWRLLQAVSRHPDASLGEVAKSVGISLKTTARRVHQLVESKACWWTHSSGSDEFPLALIHLDLEEETVRDSVTTAILRIAPSWMPVASDGLGLPPESALKTVVGLVPADNPTGLERLVGELGNIPGVANINRTFPLGSMTYPTWFTERIDERVGNRS